MSEINIKITERSEEGENEVPDEALSLPEEVHDANWHDDIADDILPGAEDETEEATSQMAYKDMMPYEDESGYRYESKAVENQEEANELDKRVRAFITRSEQRWKEKSSMNNRKVA